jgi:hypothetical protein
MASHGDAVLKLDVDITSLVEQKALHHLPWPVERGDNRLRGVGCRDDAASCSGDDRPVMVQ